MEYHYTRGLYAKKTFDLGQIIKKDTDDRCARCFYCSNCVTARVVGENSTSACSLRPTGLHLPSRSINFYSYHLRLCASTSSGSLFPSIFYASRMRIANYDRLELIYYQKRG